MKYLHTLTATLLLTAVTHGQHQTATLDEPVVGGIMPYQIELREVSLAPAAIPGIHSTAAAEWQGQWVFLAGRTNGLHGMTGNTGFDPTYENREIWVIDPKTKQSWHKNMDTSAASGLTQDLVDSLSSSNTEFYQDGENWLIVGGYGYKRSVSDHVTYNTLTAINLPGIVAWVKEAAGDETTDASDHIQQLVDDYFQITGGGLEKIGAEYQLIFGQNYAGRYRPNFNGIYSKQVRRFGIDLSNGLSVPSATKLTTSQDEAYRRRDLNITTLLKRGSSAGTFEEYAVALSGVFTPENGVFTVPVVIEAEGVVTMDDPASPDTMKQAFQIYHCAKAGLYHRATDEMHMLLFGGITVQEYDTANAVWTRDDQAPFTNQCGVVVRKSDGKFKQYFIPARFPDIRTAENKEIRFGTNAEFFYSADVPRLHSKVIDLAAIREPTVIGHIFGGLTADAGNRGNYGASGRVFEVLLTPNLPQSAQTISKTSDMVSLSWESDNHATYLIEHSADLIFWNESLPTLSGDGQILQWSETRTDPKHFYRVLGGLITRKP